MKKKQNGFVRCDKCYSIDREKPRVTTKLGIRENRGGNVLILTVVRFWNGLVYKIPLCCNLFFCKETLKGNEAIAMTVGIKRGEEHWKKNPSYRKYYG